MLSTFIPSALLFLHSLLPQPTLVEGVVGQPVHINPLTMGTNQVDRDLVRLIFQGLTRYNHEGELKGSLATHWEVSEDGKQYTVYLKPDVKWHDGQPFTADDVIYTASQYPQLRHLAVDRLDDLTIRFYLPTPFAPFLDTLTLPVLPAHLASEVEDLRPIGTGPFRLARIDKEDKIEKIVLQGEKRRVIFRFYNSVEELEIAAQLAEIDTFPAWGTKPEELFPNFVSRQGTLQGRHYAVFFNLAGNETLQNVTFRQTLAKATPKKQLLDTILDGEGLIATGPLDFFLQVELEDSYDEGLSGDLYDVEVKLTIPDTETHRKTAKLLKQAWERVGVQVEIVPVKLEELVEKVIDPKDFELLLLGQEVGRDPDRYTLWHSTQTQLPSLNFASFESPRADKALEEGRKVVFRPEVVFDQTAAEEGGEAKKESAEAEPKEDVEEKINEERKYHYQHFRDVFDEELPAIFLYYPAYAYAIEQGTVIRPVSEIDLYTPADRFLGWEELQ